MLAVVGCADMEQAGESVPSRGHKILSGVKGQTDWGAEVDRDWETRLNRQTRQWPSQVFSRPASYCCLSGKHERLLQIQLFSRWPFKEECELPSTDTVKDRNLVSQRQLMEGPSHTALNRRLSPVKVLFFSRLKHWAVTSQLPEIGEPRLSVWGHSFDWLS